MCDTPRSPATDRVDTVDSSTTAGDPLLRGDRAPRPRTLVDVLRSTADRHPDSRAIDNGREVLTYDELLEAADARRVRAAGPGHRPR